MKSRKESMKHAMLKQKVTEQSAILKNIIENEKKDAIKVKWVSKKKAALLFDVSERTIDNWKVNGKITSKYINDKPYFSIASLLDSSEE